MPSPTFPCFSFRAFSFFPVPILNYSAGLVEESSKFVKSPKVNRLRDLICAYGSLSVPSILKSARRASRAGRPQDQVTGRVTRERFAITLLLAAFWSMYFQCLVA